MPEIEKAAALLRTGRLVAFPTETVYGLGANALDREAVRSIFAAKGRPSTSPLIVHVSSTEMARTVVAEWPAVADRLAAKYWPGPLTLVLPKQESIPDEVTAGLPTVGVRVPAHPLALEMIRAANVPVAAPSANRFTQLSPTTADHVRKALGEAVDLVLDGGPTEVGIESAVLSLVGNQPALLRPGVIPVGELEAITGPLKVISSAKGSHPAPGLHERHYSPGTPLLITEHPPEGQVAWIWWQHDWPAARSVQMPADAKSYAQQLYSKLHDLDGEGWDLLALEPVPHTPKWAGVRDRLTRAATK